MKNNIIQWFISFDKKRISLKQFILNLQHSSWTDISGARLLLQNARCANTCSDFIYTLISKNKVGMCTMLGLKRGSRRNTNFKNICCQVFAERERERGGCRETERERQRERTRLFAIINYELHNINDVLKHSEHSLIQRSKLLTQHRMPCIIISYKLYPSRTSGRLCA